MVRRNKSIAKTQEKVSNNIQLLLTNKSQRINTSQVSRLAKMSSLSHSRVFLLNGDGSDRIAYAVPKGKQKIVFGSDPNCDIRLNHPDVGHKHFSIYTDKTGKVGSSRMLIAYLLYHLLLFFFVEISPN